MMKKIYFILTILISQFTLLHSQVSQEWTARYNGPGNYNDVPYDMTLDESGNIYVTGTVTSGSGSDITTIKYNSASIQLWIQEFNGGTHDAGFEVVTDNSGNVYVAGSSQGPNGANY